MPTDTFAITAEADDGTGYRTAGTWAGIGSGTYTAEETTNLWISKTTNGSEFFVDNLFLRFGTSSIPDTATPTGANLLLYVVSKGADDDSVQYSADFYDFGGEPSVAGDWEQTSSGDAILTLDPDALTTSAVNTIALTGLSGINLSGITGIRIAPKTTTQPSFSTNNIEFAAFEAAQQEPRLEVTYDVGVDPAGEAGPTLIKLIGNRQRW